MNNEYCAVHGEMHGDCYKDEDEFIEALKEEYNDDEYLKLYIKDFENIPDYLIPNNNIIPTQFFALRKALETFDDTELNAFWVWCNHYNININTINGVDCNHLISNFQNDFQGSFLSEEDYAQSYIQDNYDIPDALTDYIDYRDFAAEQLFDGEYWFEDGFVFSNY